MLSHSTASEPAKPKTVTAPLWLSDQLPVTQKAAVVDLKQPTGANREAGEEVEAEAATLTAGAAGSGLSGSQ